MSTVENVQKCTNFVEQTYNHELRSNNGRNR